jgi:hypothetical protein
MTDVGQESEEVGDEPANASSMRLRIGLGAVGVIGLLYGAKLLFSQQNVNRPLDVIKWAIGSDVLTDGVIIPFTMVVGWLVTKGVRSRARRYVQGGLIAVGTVLPIALIEIVAKNGSYVPLVHSAGKQNPSKALLTQNYANNLYLLVGIIAAATVVAYGWRVVRDRQAAAPSPEPHSDQAEVVADEL